MRITRFQIKELFGIFNHEISFNLDDRITIIHGPNGYGKTVLFNLLHDLFRSRFSFIFVTPFKEIVIGFDDQSELRLIKASGRVGKKAKEGDKTDCKLIIEFSKPGAGKKNFRLNKMDFLHSFPVYREVRWEINKELFRVETDRWMILDPTEFFSSKEVLVLLGDQLPPEIFNTEIGPNWFKKLRSSICTDFIETEGRTYLSTKEKRDRIRGTVATLMVPEAKVLKYSREFSGAAQAKLADYRTLSQKLDLSFQRRLAKKKTTAKNRTESLIHKLNTLESKRSLLISTGLLEGEKETGFQELKDMGGTKYNVLSLYIEDLEAKLEVFGGWFDRVALLVEIINNRFLYKRMSIDSTGGFVFTTSNGFTLPVEKLSSGEQHQLLLLYRLLFKVKPGSLVLLDGPEISFHVGWQQDLLGDLLEITRLVGFDLALATHSPDIIDDRWDLAIELKGPEK